MNPLEVALILVGVPLAYIVLGTVFGMFLYRFYENIYDDIGAAACGMFWPIAFPIILFIWIGCQIFKLISHAIDRKQGWTRR